MPHERTPGTSIPPSVFGWKMESPLISTFTLTNILFG